MAVPLAGNPVRASDVSEATAKRVQKTAPETVTSSTTVQNDNHFAFALPVGLWRIELFLHVFGAASTGDIRTRWTNTGTMTARGRSVIGPAATITDVRDGNTNASAPATQFSDEVVCGCDATTRGVVHEDLEVEVTVAGTLTLQWAQGTSNATATTMDTDSRAYITHLEDFA
jgi:hypothetical protein